MLLYLLGRIPRLPWFRPISAQVPSPAGTFSAGLEALSSPVVSPAPAQSTPVPAVAAIAPTHRQTLTLACPVAPSVTAKIVSPAPALPDVEEAPDAALEGPALALHATVLVLKTGPANQRMLAQRIASSRSLNCPKAIAPRKRPAASATKPIRKREEAPVRTVKRCSKVTAPRVLKPVRASAKILPFAGSIRSEELGTSPIARVA